MESKTPSQEWSQKLSTLSNENLKLLASIASILQKLNPASFTEPRAQIIQAFVSDELQVLWTQIVNGENVDAQKVLDIEAVAEALLLC